jgi:DnaJ-class molecular chaperone
VQDATRIRVAGRGGSGSNGGPAGDLYLRVTLRPHATFERRADDLHCDIEVPVEEAALGGEVRVPSLKGKTLALRIPVGTQSGRSFRLAGQGMPRKGGGFGDLHVRVLLTLPDPMSDEQRALFEQLRAGKTGTTSETGATA